MSSKNTRDRLLAAARDLLRSQGYAATSVDEIGRAAGMTKGAIYSQFQSKREVLLALMDAWASESIALLEAGRKRPFEAVRRLIYGQARRTGWSSLVLEFWRQALDDAVVGEHLVACYARLEAAVSGVLRSWRYPAEAASAARRAISLYNGVAAIAALSEERLELPNPAELEQALFQPPQMPGAAAASSA